MSTSFTSDRPGFEIIRNYLNDLSVENPFGRVPDEAADQLQQTASVRVEALPLAAEMWQVNLWLELKATLHSQVVFLAELNYRAEVKLHHIPEPVAPQILHVDVPTTIFPVIQKIVADNGSFAGYPGLQLNPIDFRSIFYKEHRSV